MREQGALMREFNEPEELVLEEGESIVDVFRLPARNWNLLIDSFNAATRRKFPLSALQCRIVVEYAKKGIPPQFIFKTLGISAARYSSMRSRYLEIEERLEALAGKESLSEEEFDEFQQIMRHPLRVLMSDIERAEGAADLADWETFNEMASKVPEIQVTKMKAKFKEMFSDRQGDAGNVNVQINLGGDFIKDI